MSPGRGCEEEEEVEGLRAVVGGPDGDVDLRHDGAEQAHPCLRLAHHEPPIFVGLVYGGDRRKDARRDHGAAEKLNGAEGAQRAHDQSWLRRATRRRHTQNSRRKHAVMTVPQPNAEPRTDAVHQSSGQCAQHSGTEHDSADRLHIALGEGNCLAPRCTRS